MPSFEVFSKGRVALSRDPLVTIQVRGLLSLNKAAHLLLDSAEAVELLYDVGSRVIGMRAVSPQSADVQFVRPASGAASGRVVVSAIAFLRCYGIELSRSLEWRAYLDDGVLCIDLATEGRPVTSNRARSQAGRLEPLAADVVSGEPAESTLSAFAPNVASTKDRASIGRSQSRRRDDVVEQSQHKSDEAPASSHGLSAEQARLDDDDLQSAVQDLAELNIGSTLDAALEQIAVFAVRAIPGADGAGVTMLENSRPATVVVSVPFVRQIDDIQYGLGEGPCITAAARGQTVLSGALGTDTAWPRFGPRARDLGVHSALSLPLLLGEEVVGALNVYAHGFDVFDAHAAQLGELFAVPAAVAVSNARTLMQAQRTAATLQRALTSRAMIDQAIGILRSRQGYTAEQAFERLRVRSQGDNVKLTTIAQTIIDDAVSRAHARRARP